MVLHSCWLYSICQCNRNDTPVEKTTADGGNCTVARLIEKSVLLNIDHIIATREHVSFDIHTVSFFMYFPLSSRVEWKSWNIVHTDRLSMWRREDTKSSMLFFAYQLLLKKEQEQAIRRLMPNGAGFVNLGCINRMFLRKSEDDVTWLGRTSSTSGASMLMVVPMLVVAASAATNKWTRVPLRRQQHAAAENLCFF